MNRITQRGGQRRRRSSLRIGATLAVAAAIALIAGGKPNEARAADGTTDVTVQVAEGDENLAWSVPTVVPMKATAAGTLIGPDAGAIAIRNLSAFPIRVKQMDTTAEAPFNLVDDVEKSSGNNDFMMTINGTAAKQTVELPDDGTWAMGYTENEDGTDVLPLTVSSAKIARVTEDLSSAKKSATVTWTVEPTEYVKPEPKPDSKNGVAFAVYSSDDNSLNFYKRDRVPDVGETLNGKTVTGVYEGVENTSTQRSPWGESINKTIISDEVVDSGIQPISIMWWFSRQLNATSLNLIKLDTSHLANMSYGFSHCSSLSCCDLSTWDTAYVTTMAGTFNGCSSLADISFAKNWKTSKVADMGDLFSGCKLLTDLTPIENWDVSNVTSTRFMFSGWASLTDLTPIKDWDTSSVDDPGWMFSGCKLLTDLTPIKDWDTSNITGLYSTFSGCISLADITPIENWDLSNVRGVSGMFTNCKSLTNIDLSKWNISDLRRIGPSGSCNGMFSDCTSLVSVDLSGWGTSHLASFKDVFAGCSSLTDVNLSNWNMSGISSYSVVPNVTRINMSGAVLSSNLSFVGDKIMSLNLSRADMSNLTRLNGMFDDLTSLVTLDCSNCDISGLTDLTGMFSRLPSSLTSLNLSGWDVSNVSIMRSMFADCSSLGTLDCIKGIKDWNVSNVTDMSSMFCYCSSLTSVNLSGWNTSKVTNITGLFSGCSSLTSINLSGWDITGVIPISSPSSYINISRLFSGCSSLTSLNISNSKWGDLNKTCSDTNNMLEGCPNLTNINVSRCDLRNGIYSKFISPINKQLKSIIAREAILPEDFSFSGSSNLAKLDLSDSDASNITDMSYMFNDCSSLTSLNLSSWDISKVTYFAYMFSGCSSLTKIDGISAWNLSGRDDYYDCARMMFDGCDNLSNLPDWYYVYWED